MRGDVVKSKRGESNDLITLERVGERETIVSSFSATFKFSISQDTLKCPSSCYGASRHRKRCHEYRWKCMWTQWIDLWCGEREWPTGSHTVNESRMEESDERRTHSRRQSVMTKTQEEPFLWDELCWKAARSSWSHFTRVKILMMRMSSLILVVEPFTETSFFIFSSVKGCLQRKGKQSDERQMKSETYLQWPWRWRERERAEEFGQSSLMHSTYKCTNIRTEQADSLNLEKQ